MNKSVRFIRDEEMKQRKKWLNPDQGSNMELPKSSDLIMKVHIPHHFFPSSLRVKVTISGFVSKTGKSVIERGSLKRKVQRNDADSEIPL